MDHNETTNSFDDIFAIPDPSTSRPSRIHFPINDAISLRRGHRPLDSSPKALSSPFNGSPVRRTSPLNPHKDLSSRSRRSQEISRANPNPIEHGASSTGGSLGLEVGVFSNEYDLSHEDPKILQGVQRALRMKARREARLKRNQASSVEYPDTNSPSSFVSKSPSKGWVHATLSSPSSPSTPPRKTSTSTASELDFSPSTGVGVIEPQNHPVPCSLDNGMTLDWTNSANDEERHERRWTLSNKRRDKDRILPLGLSLEQQEKIHEEKLKKIRNVAAPQTIRKALVTREQLTRRYRFILPSMVSQSHSLNLARVVHWYDSQTDIYRTKLEQEEPFTWLKHLNKQGIKNKYFSWNLSAHIMEEYLRALGHYDGMDTIPEDTVVENLGPEHVPLSRHLSPPYLSNSPTKEIGPYMTDGEFRRNGDSGSSSIASGLSHPLPSTAPPLNRIRTRGQQAGSKNALGDDNDSDPVSLDRNFSERSDIDAPSPRILSPNFSNTSEKPSISIVVTSDNDKPSSQLNLPSKPALSPFRKSENRENIRSSIDSSPIFRPLLPFNVLSNPRRSRISLPPDISRKRTRRKGVDEESRVFDYEVKAKLLEESKALNSRIRQLLNRLAARVNDYNATVVHSSIVLGLPFKPLPKELLEAFGHDPAAVTGITRRYKGWKAVEDIHNRVARQRQIFETFLTQFSGNSPIKKSVLSDPISSLLSILQDLENQKISIAAKANQVSELLLNVQGMHADVKDDYNSILSYTSVMYPELSEIIALEENYRDQYQQFWEFGMDALTFLLDTVTPFWRTYGKRIGDDVRDFLIIPLYRNEFTGDPKRFPIKRVPERSVWHWLCLVVCFVISIGVNILQIRAAISSSIHCRLHWIPYESVRYTALPFFWIGIILQWMAVIIELTIVFMEMGVIAWWVGWSIKVFT